MNPKAQTPKPSEYHPYYSSYIEKASAYVLPNGLEESAANTVSLLESISEADSNYRYKPTKWNIKEVLQHIIDTERIFAYRALRIARRDKTPLAGFDQNDYADVSNADKRPYSDLIAEYQAVRMATTLLFKSFSEDDVLAVGTASENRVSVRALGYMIIGHELHHCNIIKERYL